MLDAGQVGPGQIAARPLHAGAGRGRDRPGRRVDPSGAWPALGQARQIGSQPPPSPRAKRLGETRAYEMVRRPPLLLELARHDSTGVTLKQGDRNVSVVEPAGNSRYADFTESHSGGLALQRHPPSPECR